MNYRVGYKRVIAKIKYTEHHNFINYVNQEVKFYANYQGITIFI